MRVKLSYTYTHFGVTFSTNKPSYLTLDSFIAKDTVRKTSESFFWDMRYLEGFKLYPERLVVSHFKLLMEEMKNKKDSGTKEMVTYWCNRVFEYFGGDYIEDQRLYRFNYYKEKHYDEKMDFEDFVDYEIPRKWNSKRSYYDFSKSAFRPFYSDRFYEERVEDLKINYNANMAHFGNLDKKEFNKELNHALNRYGKFEEVRDLDNPKYEKPGYYFLVLDKYKQVYIGKSKNLKKRIIEHFKKEKEFDRRIFGPTKSSKISIDSFGAFDITRIYISFDNLVAHPYFGFFSHENDYIELFDNKFVTNRVMGDDLPIGIDEVDPKTITE